MVTAIESSPITEFYRHKNIFLTGGTGFVGIGLIEKILRAFPDIGNVYMLMRPKRGRPIEQRLEYITKNEVFEKLLETRDASVFKKLIAVQGDVGEPNLGLSPADRQKLVDNVHVVIHSAATLDFTESLRSAVDINLLGTRRVMELCAELKHLASMVHISSAYVNAFLNETEEILYPAPDLAERVIDLAHSLSEEALREMTPAILKDHPNSYTFTKHLAEHEVNQYADRFPCGIVRPSMICASWHEPLPGWTNSKNGPQGFLMGASMGVVRRLPLGETIIYDYTPVDFVINQVLITAQHVHKIKDNKLSIYHCTSSTSKPFRWHGVTSKVNQYLHRYPLEAAVWYPHLRFVSSLFMFKLSAIFLHFLPAFILDGLTRAAGGKPMLVRLHTNVWTSLTLLDRFIFSEWKFHNHRTVELIGTLSATDVQKFNCDMQTLDWEEYFVALTLGVRRYLSKEHPRNLERARGKDTLLLVLHLGLQALIYGTIWWLTKSLLGMTWTATGMSVPISYMLLSQL